MASQCGTDHQKFTILLLFGTPVFYFVHFHIKDPVEEQWDEVSLLIPGVR